MDGQEPLKSVTFNMSSSAGIFAGNGTKKNNEVGTYTIIAVAQQLIEEGLT